MWSHYANSHSGYVVHFEFSISDIQSYLKNAGLSHIPMYYSDNCLNLYADCKNNNLLINNKNHFNGEKNEDIGLILSALTLKSKAWEYEKEIRLFLPNIKLVNNNRNVKIKREWVKSIILGDKISSDFKGDLINIVESINQNNDKRKIDIYQAKIDFNNFSINILDQAGAPKIFNSQYDEYIRYETEEKSQYSEIIKFIQDNNLIFNSLK